MASYGLYLGRLADGRLLLVCLSEVSTVSGDGHVSTARGLERRFGYFHLVAVASSYSYGVFLDCFHFYSQIPILVLSI